MEAYHHKVAKKRVYFSIIKSLSAAEETEPPLFPWEKSISDYNDDGTDPPPPGHDKSEPSPAAESSADQ
jgi:hypothetical protein